MLKIYFFKLLFCLFFLMTKGPQALAGKNPDSPSEEREMKGVSQEKRNVKIPECLVLKEQHAAEEPIKGLEQPPAQSMLVRTSSLRVTEGAEGREIVLHFKQQQQVIRYLLPYLEQQEQHLLGLVSRDFYSQSQALLKQVSQKNQESPQNAILNEEGPMTEAGGHSESEYSFTGASTQGFCSSPEDTPSKRPENPLFSPSSHDPASRGPDQGDESPELTIGSYATFDYVLGTQVGSPLSSLPSGLAPTLCTRSLTGTSESSRSRVGTLIPETPVGKRIRCWKGPRRAPLETGEIEKIESFSEGTQSDSIDSSPFPIFCGKKFFLEYKQSMPVSHRGPESHSSGSPELTIGTVLYEPNTQGSNQSEEEGLSHFSLPSALVPTQATPTSVTSRSSNAMSSVETKMFVSPKSKECPQPWHPKRKNTEGKAFRRLSFE